MSVSSNTSLEISLAGLRKLAGVLGVSLVDLERIAIEQGVPVARQFLQNYCRGAALKAKPRILKNLSDKAPLDGKRRKDKDGVDMSDKEFFIHEAAYLVIKSVVKKGGLFIDGIRDIHFPKLVASVIAAGGDTPEGLVDAWIDAQLNLVF
jgi:hypothetical protein